MTRREGQRSGGASHAASPPAPDRAPKPPAWEELFCAATAAQQAELLDLARRQGMLYGHQLPAPANGPPREDFHRFLNRVLAGKTGDLPTVPAVPLDLPSLDVGQREAVARALATPDICLIKGLPVSGKSYVAAEIAAR